MVVSYEATQVEMVNVGSSARPRRPRRIGVEGQYWDDAAYQVWGLAKWESWSAQIRLLKFYGILDEFLDGEVEEYRLLSEVVEGHFRQIETSALCVRFADEVQGSKSIYLSLLALSSALHSVSALYHIRLEAYRSRSAM